MSILEVKGLQKIYTTRFGGNKVEALRNVTFSVEEGEYVAIMGESGSGKTTLLNIIAALDKATSGRVLLDGKDLGNIKESQIAAFRRDNLGFVFQDFNLLDTFSLEDNIFLPLVLAGKSYGEMCRRIKPVAAELGITDLLRKYPYEVSGGGRNRERRWQEPSLPILNSYWPTNLQGRWILRLQMNCSGFSAILTEADRPYLWSLTR